MHHAYAFASLADCLRPGFARHWALSRARRSPRVTSGALYRRWNQTAAWGESTSAQLNNAEYAVPEHSLRIESHESRRPKEQSANNTQSSSRQQQWSEDARSPSTLDAQGQVDRERQLWEQGSTQSSLLYRLPQRAGRLNNPHQLQQMLENSPTAILYQRMRFAASVGEVKTVWKIAHYLLNVRKEEPNAKLYTNLILSHCSAALGSAHWVKSFLEEMRSEGLELDSGICHDVLKVLAVHPDFLLRTEILHYMRSRWFTLSADGRHDVAASLLREGQLELGIEALDNMSKDGIRIQSWLHDLALHILCNNQELEEAVRVMQSYVASTDQKISPVIWSRLLETSADALHYEGTAFVWKRYVQHGFLNPSSGVCLNVLKLAARRADIDLATDVFRVLAERGTVFDAEHYELLMEAYISAKDLRSALSLLCVMHDTDAQPDLGGVRGLVYHLRRFADRRERAFGILQDLHKEREIPIIAMNALIESAVAGNSLDEAIEYYKAAHDICVSPSRDVDTFNILLRGCRSSWRKDIAMFLASEMVALGIKPNALTYDRLVLICIKDADPEDAYRYYFEMINSGFKPRLGTLFHLAKTAASAADQRTIKLIEDMDSFGAPAMRPKALIAEKFRAAEEAAWQADASNAKAQSTGS